MSIDRIASPPNFRNTVNEHIQDPVTYELMTQAVSLVPCGHTLNKDTAVQCIARNNLCPLDREPIERYIPNYTIQKLAEAASQPHEEEPGEEAKNYFEQAKTLLEQNDYQNAIPLLLEALQLYPQYEKAQAYLDLCLARSSTSDPEALPSSSRKALKKKKSKSIPQNPKDAYLNLLLSYSEKSWIKKYPNLARIFQGQIDELMNQEEFTPIQQTSYKWIRKLYINHKVINYVATKLESLHASSQGQSNRSSEDLSPQNVFASPSIPSQNAKAPPPIPQVAPNVVILQYPIQPALPPIAFGKAKWAQYFGDIGIEPPLPPNIHEILNARCPFLGSFWNGKKVRDTHILTLIPRTVNGKPFTLNTLSELIQHPQGGGKATQYSAYWDKIRKEYGDRASQNSYWVLFTKDVIPGSRNKTYKSQVQLLTTYNQKSHLPYEVPLLLEAATSLLMEHVQTGTRLYNDSPWTWTRCQEHVSKHPSWPLVVGGFAAAGLGVDYDCLDYEFESSGVGGCRKF